MSEQKLLPLDHRMYSENEMCRRVTEFYAEIKTRRTVRDFSDRPVPKVVIEEAIRAAGTSPSGANQQPWHFAVITDRNLKRQIREAAEEEERAFYENRAPDEWLEALSPLGTDANKSFLETAPYLIVIFSQNYRCTDDGEKLKNYYVQESVGIATGILITAIHQAGLVSLTHTPSPMGFLSSILGRPVNERPFLILVVGYPSEDTKVPDIKRKTLQEITTFL